MMVDAYQQHGAVIDTMILIVQLWLGPVVAKGCLMVNSYLTILLLFNKNFF